MKTRPNGLAWFSPAWPGLDIFSGGTRNQAKSNPGQAKWPGLVFWPGLAWTFFLGGAKTRPNKNQARPNGLAWFSPAWPGLDIFSEGTKNQAKWPGLVFAGLAWPGHFSGGTKNQAKSKTRPGQKTRPNKKPGQIKNQAKYPGPKTRPNRKPGQMAWFCHDRNQAARKIQAGWRGFSGKPGPMAWPVFF